MDDPMFLQGLTQIGLDRFFKTSVLSSVTCLSLLQGTDLQPEPFFNRLLQPLALNRQDLADL